MPSDMYSYSRIKENWVKTVKFRNPEWIPARIGTMPATWNKYKQDLEEIVLLYPAFFPGYQKGEWEKIINSGEPTYKEGRFTDAWGCVWDNKKEGLEGLVVEFPLSNWDNFKNYAPPDPVTQGDKLPFNWQDIEENLKKMEEQGKLKMGYFPHGFMFMRVYYLRGFENFMIDIAVEDKRLVSLINMVLDFNSKLVDKWIELGVELISFGDDLGTQVSLPISPGDFQKFFKPCYKKIFQKCKDNGIYVYMHSDGHILEIIDDLIECNIDILNPQVGANTLQGLQQFKGKVCIDLDLDRQLFPFAKPDEIKEHIKEAISTLNQEQGGLILYAECEPDVPLENINAICETFQEFAGPCIY